MLPSKHEVLLPVEEDEFLFPEHYKGRVPQLRQLGQHEQPAHSLVQFTLVEFSTV